jgi:hypothetical protein
MMSVSVISVMALMTCDVHDYLEECDVFHGHRNESDVHDDFDTAIVMLPVMALMT